MKKQIILGAGKLKVSDQVLMSLQRRSSGSTMACEYGQPIRPRGMSDEDWIRRLRMVELDKVCLVLDEIDRTACGGYLMGTVYPAGAYKGLMETYLSNDNLVKQLQLTPRGFKDSKGEWVEIITFDLSKINY